MHKFDVFDGPKMGRKPHCMGRSTASEIFSLSIVRFFLQRVRTKAFANPLRCESENLRLPISQTSASFRHRRSTRENALLPQIVFILLIYHLSARHTWDFCLGRLNLNHRTIILPIGALVTTDAIVCSRSRKKATH